jgi:ribosomal protein S7
MSKKIAVISIDHFINSINVSTRGKRRKALCIAIKLLEIIRQAEEDNINNFHQNFWNSDAFANADYSLDILTDAICSLVDAY